MTSVTNSSGLNYQNGINPLGRKVRALETEVVELRKEINALKAGGTATTSNAAPQQTSVSSTFNADVEYLKREIAIIKAAGYGKGEKGEKGEKGDKGDKGDRGEPGPMTYIAMPANTVPTTTSTSSA